MGGGIGQDVEESAELMTRLRIGAIGFLRCIPRKTLVQRVEIEFLFGDVAAFGKNEHYRGS